MKSPMALAVVLALLLIAPPSTAAQTTAQVTVKVPVIATQLSLDIKGIRVTCNFISDALTGTDPSHPNSVSKYEDLPVSGGEIVKIVTMVFSVTLSNPAGQPARVACWLEGFTAVSTGAPFEGLFNEAATNPALRVTKTSVTQAEVTFVW